MNNKEYISSERYFEGNIIEITDGGVLIELRGRLGSLKIPKRMLISKEGLELGQRVGFMMTYPEVIED